MGPRAISTVPVDHFPDVLPASFARRRYRSAHSGTLIRGGGVIARRTADDNLVCFEEPCGVDFPEIGKVFVDMVV